MEEKICEEELQILINLLEEKLEVKYPLYEIKLLEATPKGEGYSLKFYPEKADFQKRFEEVSKYCSNELREDLPRFRDFFEVLLASGVISYRNLEEFQRQIESYERLKKGIVFCPDTNVLYHRFFSNFFKRLPEKIGIVDIVKNEIERRMNYKYRGGEIEEYFSLPNGHLMRDLRNRRNLKSRRAAYLAMEEFKHIKPSVLTISSKGIRGKDDDEKIVKSVKKFDNENPTLAVLLTADIALTDVAEMEGIEYFLFEIPKIGEISKSYIDAKRLRRLIFTLSAIFGVIELNSCIIYGEFGGKTKTDEMKVVCDDSLGRKLRHHLNICRLLLSLQISDRLLFFLNKTCSIRATYFWSTFIIFCGDMNSGSSFLNSSR